MSKIELSIPAPAEVPSTVLPKIVATPTTAQPTPKNDATGKPAVNGAITINGDEAMQAAEAARVAEEGKDDISKMDRAALEKSYKEIRTKMSQGKKEEAEKPAPTAEEKAAADKAAADALAATKTEEAAKAQEAYDTAVTSAFEKAVGGADKVPEVLKWASENLDAKSAKAFNDALDSGNEMFAMTAINILTQKYTEVNGIEPSLVTAPPARGTGAVQPFRDTGEMMDAMNDRRYSTSAAYRKDVEARVAASKF